MTPPEPVVQKVDSAVQKALGGGPVLLGISGGLLPCPSALLALLDQAAA